MSGIAGYVQKLFTEFKEARQSQESDFILYYWNTMARYSSAVQGAWKLSESTLPQSSRVFLGETRKRVKAGKNKLIAALANLDFSLETASTASEADKGKLLSCADVLRDWRKLDEFKDRVLPEFVESAVWSGTGILRGHKSFSVTSEFEQDEETKIWVEIPKQEVFPGSSVVPVWNFYPDPLSTTIEGGRGVIVLHNFDESRLRDEAEKLNWDLGVVEKILEKGNRGEAKQEWETAKESALKKDNVQEDTVIRIVEFWGRVKVKDLQEAGITVKKEFVGFDFQPNDYVEACAVCCGAEILYAMVNPYYPRAYRPFLKWVWDSKPDSFWGVGVAEELSDYQRVMNGIFTALLENVRHTSTVQYQIREDYLIPGQDTSEIFPGKRWYVSASAPPGANAVEIINQPSIINDLMATLAILDRRADTATGLSDLQQGTAGAVGARTATATAILQQNFTSDYAVKVGSLESVLETKEERAYRWFMIFGDNDKYGKIKISAKVKALGSSKSELEINQKTQKLIQTIQSLPGFMNLPKEGPQGSSLEGAKLDGLPKELFETLGLRDIYKTESEKRQEEEAKAMQFLQQLESLLRATGGRITPELRGILAALMQGGQGQGPANGGPAGSNQLPAVAGGPGTAGEQVGQEFARDAGSMANLEGT